MTRSNLNFLWMIMANACIVLGTVLSALQIILTIIIYMLVLTSSPFNRWGNWGLELKWLAQAHADKKRAKWASQMALVVKNLPVIAGERRDAVLIPESGSSSGGGNGNPLQFSCLENSHGQRSLVGYCPWVTKSQTWLKRLSMHARSGSRCFTLIQSILRLVGAPFQAASLKIGTPF